MKKLTPVQIDSIRSRHGLISPADWTKCVSHLHARLTDEDPAGADVWQKAMASVKRFVEWAVWTSGKKFSDEARDCLALASQHRMSAELIHEENETPCVFSQRCTPALFRSPSHPSPACVSVRVQCNFSWWAHHEETGLECPHTSRWFVYESMFSYLVKGVFALGHLSQMLEEQSRTMQPAGLGAEEFAQQPVWQELLDKINCILFVVRECLDM
jgi:hypothetical protein